MATYVALLRGIMPNNPNMRSEKLKAAFESAGLKNVATVIASGNVVFTSPSKDTKKLEDTIETTLHAKLGFKRAAIIRSEDELKKLVKKDPFKGIKDERPNYLIVTFFKDRRKELSTVLNLDDSEGTPAFMSALEKKHSKALTTRTWKTVGRILKKMEETL
jgi:uncharacterized protein (DUF1697 family)